MMRKILGIVSPLKVIWLFPLLFFFSLSQVYAADITLQWDASTGPDLDHYVVYWGIDYFVYNSEKKGDLIDKDTTTYTVTGLSDDKTYYFAAKAFDAEGRESQYSNIVGSEDDPDEYVPEQGPPPTVSGAGGGGCFIATAAYGSTMDKHVKILSEFRDRHLLTNSIGRDIVDAYYKFSPPFAGYLHKHPSARAVVRYALIPITGIAYISLSIHPLALLFAFILLLFTIVYIARHFLQSRINISQ